jgi:hypothetical protein
LSYQPWLRSSTKRSLRQLLSVEGYEEDGDVVVAAFDVGGVDEGLAGGVEIGLRGAGWDACENCGDVFVGEFSGEAVGGEEVEVAGLGVVALDVAGAELLFDEGVVAGELFEVSAAAAVTAAVADVDDPEGGRIGGAGVGVAVGCGGVEECDEGGAHAGELRGLAGLLVDGLIGGLNGGVEAGLWSGGSAWRRIAGRGRGDVCEEGVCGEMASDFAACGSAHAIAYDEGADGRIGGAGVLVAAPDLAAVGEHGVDEFVGWHL